MQNNDLPNPINISIIGKNGKTAFTPKTISKNGCDFYSSENIPIMTKLSLSIDFSEYNKGDIKLSPIDQILSFEGTVVRTEKVILHNKPFYLIAVFFGELPKRITDTLSILMEHIGPNQKKALRPIKRKDNE